ncbi:30S ribosomal protein S1 [Amphritea sp. 2_MG-2023]|uniref:30S ribosomal protein S1 n=1 Tax=Amphritea TaxID=515417 RepID=UPI001C07179B|nr:MULTISPECIES: 30S ribosomal protein S1 [Amphritea]MBU2965123.1 30S ribosomal protein S1 [Amphritea atlantica]MDO6418908.1 30S ribosomal protein S1 [Amphritea sp. 2_MG-2023]
MNESFAELFEESLTELDMQPGSVVDATVVAVDGDFVVVNAGLKSEGNIPLNEFLDDDGKLNVSPGDQVKVVLVSLEDGSGETLLSREKAKRAEAWQVLEQAFENDTIVTGRITGKVRGGLTVDLNTISAFLPGSLVDIRPLRDTSHLENQELEFKLVKLDAKQNNIVVSRRAVLETAYNEERDKLLATLNEGMAVKGVVKNLTDYGAFIDLGGVDGLLHITDIAWKRVKHPSELLSIGDEIDVKVLRYDREKGRVSLGMKQLTADPWDEFKAAHPVGSRVSAKVTNIADYGCFAEIKPGIEGLVHVSEMDWTSKNIHPSKIVQVGEQIEVMILDINDQRRRISLGIKQCQANPWEVFAATHAIGTQVSGMIKSITDFGLFVGLDGGIDGLVHLSDLSWDQPADEAVKAYHKGDTVSAVVLSVDAERGRISLGIKQLSDDPFTVFTAANPKGTVVKGEISQVESKQLRVQLAEGVEGTVKVQEVSFERVDDLSQRFSAGTIIDVLIVNIDRRARTIALSVKQLEKQQEKQALDAIRHQQLDSEGPATIGDLIRAQLDKNK